MNGKKIISIVIGIAIVVAFVYKLKSNKETTTEKIYYYDKEQAIQVKTQTIRFEEVSNEMQFSGTFDANRESKISAETQGKINQISVDVGDFVEKGETLIQLDNALLYLQMQAVAVQIEGLEADVTRFTILSKSDAINGVQLEKATLGLKSAKIQKATLQEQINKTTIKAPFSGFITYKFTEIGAFAAPGVPLLQVTDLHELKFTVSVSENDLNLFSLGKNYTVKVDIYPDELLIGKATHMGSKANMGGSYPVQFTVKNLADSKIKSGMFGKVFLKNETSEKGYIIPSSAILGSSNDAQVYLIKDGKAVLKAITIKEKIANTTVVSQGINDGDVIITEGLINLFDGANVSFN
ncbi:MAG: efflux RND transporter periplasmic adaptor subunit [Flavobacteriales bacterium]|nr:efflux RND transporter periplasmic adaptor subunit [Flavobacteriales bacterium]